MLSWKLSHSLTLTSLGCCGSYQKKARSETSDGGMDIQRIKFPSVAKIYLKDPNVKREDVQEVEDWLEAQPHLPQLTQHQIVSFLHSCYYKLPDTKSTIEKYFTFRTNSFMFKDVDEDLVRRVLATFFTAFLPEKTPDGDVVFVMRNIDTKLENYNHLDYIKVVLAIMSLYFHQYGPANGLILVIDMEGISLGHLLRTSFSALKHLIYFVQEAAPVRLKSANHINTIPITGRFVAAVRPFIRKEIYNMMKFHYSYETFYEVVPRECLPKEYGGFLPSIQELQEKNLKNILSHWNILEWHNTQRVDESKRIRKEKRLFGNMQKIFSS